MTAGVHAATVIFEDPVPTSPTKSHKRGTSVSDVFRGRRRENSPAKQASQLRNGDADPSPLGERHINSPPQVKRVPLKGADDTSRLPLHQKTGSSTSLKGLFSSRDRSTDGNRSRKDKEEVREHSPSKSKYGSNFAGLLKKRSRKDLKENMAPMEAEKSPTSELDSNFWSQPSMPFYPKSNGSVPSQQIRSPVRSSVAATSSHQQHLQNARHSPPGSVTCPVDSDAAHRLSPDLRLPRRPFLEHKSSRSSIFTENLDDEVRDPGLMNEAKSPTDHQSPLAPTSNASNYATKDQISDAPTRPEARSKRSSRILDTIAALHMRARQDDPVPVKESSTPLNPQELDSAMENMLGRYDIPQNLRDQLRNLKPEVKAGLVKGERVGSGSSVESSCADTEVRSTARGPGLERPTAKDEDGHNGKRSRSRSKTRSRILSFSSKRGDRSDSASPSKPDTHGRSRSKSRPKSVELGRPLSGRAMSSTTSLTPLATPDSATTPGDFIHYLREVQKPELVEVGKLHKLRILVRHESVAWTDAFVNKGGMDEIVQLLHRIMQMEWREEHEDSLLHETLLCLKGLSTTSLAMQRLDAVSSDLLPALLKMLFDPERKGPAEYNTRGVIISLIFAHLSETLPDRSARHVERARKMWTYLRDQTSETEKQPLEFVTQMHTARPYRVWAKEVTNVTKEVFWIFLHQLNVVPILATIHDHEPTFTQAYYPTARAPHPAAPYVGGVEWDATQYLANHLDLLNGLIVSLPTREERNRVRIELRQSGWEKVMGHSLRTCKEKFYAGVHDGLRAWVAAAHADGWPVEDVRAGPPREAVSPLKSPVKRKGGDAPQLDVDVGVPVLAKADDGWLS